MKKIINLFIVIGLSTIFYFEPASTSGKAASKSAKRDNAPLQIKVTPWGPSQSQIEAAKSRVEQSFFVQKELAGTIHRIISFEYIENDDKYQKPQPPTRFRVTFYDYTNARAFTAESDFAGTEIISVNELKTEPGVGSEEIRDAFEIVKNDQKFRTAFNANSMQVFEAMPPITMLNGERLVNVGIKSQSDGSNKIVGISFRDRKIVYYQNDAPPTSLSAPDSCGIASAGQETTANGTAGQATLTVSQNNAVIWEMLITRPSASSGNPNERSGIDIRDVKYKGKSVLKRGHVPILNVEYAGDQCGPYRDWQYQEGFFNAPEAGATDLIDGIRILADGQTAQTMLDSGNDAGNFRGVAIYKQNVGYGTEVVLVSEMDAGWYRYIMEWRFAPDGTIRPRYGFGATNSACVCYVHTHHAYWRFDFDIVTPVNRIYQLERGRKFQTPITNEFTRLRSYQTNRSFLIQNSTGNEAYMLVPNITDGVADSFGAGDLWFLRFKDGPGEIDDPNFNPAANFTPWLNNESLVNQDVVVWYAGHFIHADDSNRVSPHRGGEVLTNSHVVGPDLRPVQW